MRPVLYHCKPKSLFNVIWNIRHDALYSISMLTHWGRMTHICVSKLTTIGSDNGLSPGRRQAIFWTNDGILSIGPLRTNVGEILIKMYTFSFKEMRLKVWSAKRWPFCFGLNVLIPFQNMLCCCYIINIPNISSFLHHMHLPLKIILFAGNFDNSRN